MLRYSSKNPLDTNLVIQPQSVIHPSCQSVHIGAESANLGVDSTNLGVDSINLGVDSTNLGVDSINLGVDSTNLGVDSTNLGAHLVLTGFKSIHAFMDETEVFACRLNEGSQLLRQLGEFLSEHETADGFSPLGMLSENPRQISYVFDG